ncbi:hypothetical protein P9112_012838 [Eukaryota sp. TZLM1-RC]
MPIGNNNYCASQAHQTANSNIAANSKKKSGVCQTSFSGDLFNPHLYIISNAMNILHEDASSTVTHSTPHEKSSGVLHLIPPQTSSGEADFTSIQFSSGQHPTITQTSGVFRVAPRKTPLQI